jgi:thioredoxin-like negative regulator of GroEL
MKSGGIFRLCKVNSDQNRDLAEALEVSGLPTVYTVDKGKFNDK